MNTYTHTHTPYTQKTNTHKHEHTQTHTNTDTQTHRRIYGPTDLQKEKSTFIFPDIWMDGPTDGQTDTAT